MLTYPLGRKARSLWRQPRFIRGWLLPTWLLLGVSRAVILGIPFKRLAPWLGSHEQVAPWVPLLNPTQESRALQVGRVVRLAARYTPWISNCFPQAIVARLLLGLYGVPYVIYFGVARNDAGQGMKAHAWVVAGRIAVTGGHSFGAFTAVGCFMSQSLARTATL